MSLRALLDETYTPSEEDIRRAVSGNFCRCGGEMLSFLVWIIFGLIVGALAKLLMPGRDPGGIIVTILLGIVGALLGGFLGRAMGFYGPGEAAGFVMSLIGAMILLFLYRLLVTRRT
jgi:uncharacterized membrane protein YeaQ/YmgE (transglycosylase-associated protein family)